MVSVLLHILKALKRSETVSETNTGQAQKPYQRKIKTVASFLVNISLNTLNELKLTQVTVLKIN
jgi:molybdenum cofactor biosynthesis enzyme MoaA